MSISVEAAEARDSLTDEKELISTYEVDIFVGSDNYFLIEQMSKATVLIF